MESQGIPYFSLMCQQNEQWDEIETEYGLKGFAILVKLYQKIFSSNGYYCQWTKEIEQAFAQKNCGLPKNSQNPAKNLQGHRAIRSQLAGQLPKPIEPADQSTQPNGGQAKPICQLSTTPMGL